MYSQPIGVSFHWVDEEMGDKHGACWRRGRRLDEGISFGDQRAGASRCSASRIAAMAAL